MARFARIIAPGFPHHVTQRGNRRQPVFFCADDYRAYLQLLREQSHAWGFALWAYCLMTNHIHLLVVPTMEGNLMRGIGETHRLYTRRINFREGWRGYLWQGRFASVVLDEPHLYAAVRYIERNPVEAGLVKRAEEYPWSSARAHVNHHPDPVLAPSFLTDTIQDWRAFLADTNEPETVHRLEQHSRTGRPLGTPNFLTQLEERLGRPLRKAKPGPKVAKSN